MTWFEALFGTGQSLTWGQESARAVVIFVYGLALVRIAGRRVFGKWSAVDIIVSVVAGSNLSRALTGSAPFGGTLIATAVLMALHWILSHAVARSPRLSAFIEGASIVLARDGQVDASKLRQDAISQSDLDEALRQQGVEQVGQTRLIALEPSGKITVLKA